MKQANLGLSLDELIDRQAWLQQQASDLLEHFGILDMLRCAGIPRVAGSIETGLMVWPDIDLEVLTPGAPDLSIAHAVAAHLGRETGATKINIGDTRRNTDPNLPRGIHLGPRIEHNGLRWQMDIWFIDHEQADQRRELVKHFMSLLNDAARGAILQIKQVAAASDNYHRGVSSVDIYTAVLDLGVTDLRGFESYLQQTGRAL